MTELDRPQLDDAARGAEQEDQHHEDVETIHGLRQEITTDHAVMSDLRDQGVADRKALNTLQERAELDHAIILALIDQGEVDRDQIAHLERALVSARRIGPTIGILMNAQKIAKQEAFDMLRVASQHSHRKLRDIAEDVILTGTTGS